MFFLINISKKFESHTATQNRRRIKPNVLKISEYACINTPSVAFARTPKNSLRSFRGTPHGDSSLREGACKDQLSFQPPSPREVAPRSGDGRSSFAFLFADFVYLNDIAASVTDFSFVSETYGSICAAVRLLLDRSDSFIFAHNR